MKMRSSLFLIIAMFIVSLIPVRACCENYDGFVFEEIGDDALQQVKDTLNNSKTAKKLGIKYTSDDISGAVQYTRYSMTELYRYNGGPFKEFIEKNSDDRYTYMEVTTPKYPDSSYNICVGTNDKGRFVQIEKYNKDYWAKGYEKNYIRNNIERTAKRYMDGGKIYICDHEWIDIGVVCDENDIPKYVVCRDSHFNFDKRRDNVDTDNEEIIKLLDTFDTLYNSYDWKVYDDKNKYQYVFDFDFFVDVDKAVHGALPDDYVFEPHGLEMQAKNTIKTIDGRAYRFSKYGVCTGLYTGWSNTKSGRRFFRRGELVTGKTKINGKTYEFDKKGYLK